MTEELLGVVPPTELVDARIQLHWAAQLAAAVGNRLLPEAPDDSQSNFEWLRDLGALAGGLAVGTPRLRSALRIADLQLLVLDDANRTLEALPLQGCTSSQGLDWLGRTVSRRIGEVPKSLFELRRYEGMPEHSVGIGPGSFEVPQEALAELSRWYAIADRALRAIASQHSDASAVRCWPHHFDIATLITLAGSAENARTVGIGMCPGDTSHEEPYWSVNAWPFPEDGELPKLAAGSWYTEDWNGAVLTGSELVAAGDAKAQAARLSTFLDSAIAASLTLLGKGPGGA